MDIRTDEQMEKELRDFRNMLVERSAASAQAAVENRGAPKLVGSGAVVRLRSLTFVCVAQAAMALVMGALGTVGSETVIPACYFSFSTFVGVWLLREKPNDGPQPRA